MWYLLAIPAAALAAYLYGQKHPAASKDAIPPGTPGAGPANAPGAPRGTGILDAPVAGVPARPAGTPAPVAGVPSIPAPVAPPVAGVPLLVDNHGTGVVDLTQQQAAAARAAALLVQGGPQGPGKAAGLAAETVKLQIIDALNTPDGDRTPEQLALLSSLAALPVFSPDAK